MYLEKPLNIQLFASESDNNNGSDSNLDNKTPKEQKQQETTSTVSKELYDKTASEVAELKKQLKELQKTGKSEAELKEIELKEKDLEIKKANEDLNNLYLQLNLANANANVAEIKSKINLENTESLDMLIQAIITTNGDETTKRSKAFSELLKSVYEKGISDSRQQEWSSMSNNIKSGSSSVDNETVSFIKNISKNNNIDTTGIKDKFK